MLKGYKLQADRYPNARECQWPVPVAMYFAMSVLTSGVGQRDPVDSPS